MQTASMEYQNLLNEAREALYKRTYYTPYPEHPKAYGEGGDEAGLKWFQTSLSNRFKGIKTGENVKWVGSEVSPFMQIGLGIEYPQKENVELVAHSAAAAVKWQKVTVLERAGVLIKALEGLKGRFFDLAYATMHTSGQSFMMSFQASGPHSNDRALETIAQGVEELSKYPNEVDFVKPMGKFDLTIKKNFKAMPKGIGLVIGCSTFPTWNTVPGVFANLICGNPVIIKPHPKAILPIAIVVEELQKAFEEAGFEADIVQLAVDTLENPVAKELALDEEIKLIDYTGSNSFGDYLESLDKVVFTEKAGVNSILIESVNDMEKVAQNIAFSTCLYSGQMCTAPQNIYISKDGVKTDNGQLSFDETVKHITDAIKGLSEHPKMGSGTLGAIQNDNTTKRMEELKSGNGILALDSVTVVNPEFPDARINSPIVLVVNSTEVEKYRKECFGPVVIVVKTESYEESLALTAQSAKEKGAITCLAYSTDNAKCAEIENTMNKAFTPVSFNFTGAAFVNQHAAFSDFHVTGGNPAGNATFTNSEYISKRIVWIGNRYA